MKDGKKFLQTTGGVLLSLGVLFATVWVVSKAWKSGQKNKTA
jgi:hypothetical protein